MSIIRSEPADARRTALTEALAATALGDHDAFERVYDLTSAKLFGICLRICGERQDAADVLSEVYLTIWKQAGAYEPGRASPITWLATIARNRAIDWRRTNRVRTHAPIEAAPERPDDAPSPAELLLQNELKKALRECMETLTEPQRQAITGAFFDGLTYAELAVRGAVPLGTMKSWVRRGLIRLRECLDERD